METITQYLTRSTVTRGGEVRAWEEEIMLPTYEVGEEEKSPLFLEKRVYQGSSGVVYPYRVIEKVGDLKTDKPYRAFFLENEYLKIMVLPGLGGRIQMAYDKVRERHFVYYNQVVKPALVGLVGPWISGGIEFNWPQHHRPGTFKPTDCTIERGADGSMTVWCNEVERMSRTKGMHGITLRPGKACVEIRVKVYNRTPFPQTFLWWANPAVRVDDNYGTVFPPDVNAVFDHGKRDVSDFPIATGTYYKHDYSAGVDISKYRNIPVPTSYMAAPSKYDFLGGYDEALRAGLLHVADHRFSPGKKQWTWGTGDFGRAWERNLTDEDGPYVELMTGVYTDNQPDFSWLGPYEEKSWVQYFMPYAGVGRVKNASCDIIAGVETADGTTRIVVYATERFAGLRISLTGPSGKIYLDRSADISPRETFEATVDTGGALPEELLLEVRSADNTLMLDYRAEKPRTKATPDPADAADAPKDIASVEELFLTGLHLEQYRHATFNPMDYWMEALRREPGDVRCNNAVGLYYMRRGQFEKAEPRFRTAIETLTRRNPNPYDGEPLYNLGNCLLMQGRDDEAFDVFCKSAWNAAWQDPAWLATAQIEAKRGDWGSVLEKTERSLVRNAHNHKARQLKASALRKTGRKEEALRWIEESLEIDRFNIGCRFEKWLLTGRACDAEELTALAEDRIHTYIEYALDFAASGMYGEASGLLSLCPGRYPMAGYALGWFASLQGLADRAQEYYRLAASMPPDGCFPNRIEEVIILRDAIRVNPADAKALYYLGNFWYAARQYAEALECWERSAELDETFPTVLRNIALTCYNKFEQKERARRLLERAFVLDPTDARMLMELDQLYKKTGRPLRERLALLESCLPVVEQRDDLCVERITLLNLLGDCDKALELLRSRKFHPWEGGEGKVSGQWVFCHREMARRALDEKRYADALELLHRAGNYPPNLGEGKLPTLEENDLDYYKGVAHRALGEEAEARACFERATRGPSEATQAFFYNDPQPDKIYYQGLAWEALGDSDMARSRFEHLVAYGEEHLDDDTGISYFAVSWPDLEIWDDDLNHRNRIHCNYVMALGWLGLGDTGKAGEYMDKVKSIEPNHEGAAIHAPSITRNL